MKKLTAFIITLFMFYGSCANISSAEQCKGLLYNRVEKNQTTLIAQPTNKNIQSYVNSLLLRSKIFYFKKNYVCAADDLRSALYFLGQDKSSSKYQKVKQKLDKTIKKGGFDTDEYSRLEVAKNLFLECKYFASGYEFLELIKSNYQPQIAYAYLGDIIQKISSDKQSALIYYKKSLEIEPVNPDVTYKAAQIYMQTGDYDLAYEMFSRTVNLTNDSDVLNNVILIYSQVIEKDSKDANAYEIIAQAYQKLGDYKKTYRFFQKAIELNPSDIFLKYNLGGLLQETGEYKKAIAVYNSILTQNPWESQIRISKAKCLTAIGKINDALKQYQIVLAIYPDSSQAKYGVYTLLKRKNSLDTIIKSLYPLNEKFNPTSKFYSDFGDLLNQMKQYADAEIMYKKALKSYKLNAHAYCELYKLYELSGNDSAAYELAKEAYKYLPQNPEIKKIFFSSNQNTVTKKKAIALSYLKNNQFEKAISTYKQIEPKTAEIYLAIANCSKFLKNQTEALNNYKAAMKLDPTNSDIYYSIALIYLEKNDINTTQYYLKKSISLNKSNLKALKLMSFVAQKQVDVILDKAYSLYQKKDYKNALAVLGDGIKKYPKNSQVYYYRALTYNSINSPQSAIKDLKYAIKLNRGFDLAYYTLGETLEKYGKEKEALEVYERFLSMEPAHKELVKKAQQKVISLGKKYY